jgi:hypothetical protein
MAPDGSASPGLSSPSTHESRRVPIDRRATAGRGAAHVVSTTSATCSSSDRSGVLTRIRPRGSGWSSRVSPHTDRLPSPAPFPSWRCRTARLSTRASCAFRGLVPV